MNDKTEQTTANALPCPFCGSTEGFYVEEGSTFRWRVISCRNCGEGTEVRHKNNSDEPESYLADWNAAAPYPAMLRKEIETLRAQLAEAQKERDKAIDLLETMFSSYENGTACYEDPEDCSGFVGYAFKMDDLDFNACCDFLNRTRPRAAIDAAKGESNE